MTVKILDHGYRYQKAARHLDKAAKAMQEGDREKAKFHERHARQFLQDLG